MKIRKNKDKKKKRGISYIYSTAPFEYKQRRKKTRSDSRSIAQKGGVILGSKNITEDDFNNGVPHLKEIDAMGQSDFFKFSGYVNGEIGASYNELSKAQYSLEQIKQDPDKYINEPIQEIEKQKEKELAKLDEIHRPKKIELESEIKETKDDIKTCKEERAELSEELGIKKSAKKVQLMSKLFYIGSIFIFAGELFANKTALLITQEDSKIVWGLAISISVAMYLSADYGGRFLKSIVKNRKHSYSQ